MKYVIEFDLPDNDTVLNNIKTAWVGWNVWGYSGCAHAKPKQPERKKGKWLWDLADNGWANHICSECRWTKNTDIHVSLGYKFCPNCGCAMTEEGDQDG